MTSLDVITNKNGFNQLIRQMKVGLYRHGVNQAQGHLLNVNYYCCVITEQKHSNPPLHWCIRVRGINLLVLPRSKSETMDRVTSTNVSKFDVSTRECPTKVHRAFLIMSDANASIQLILQRSRLHSPFTAYFYHERLRRIFGRASPRGLEG